MTALSLAGLIILSILIELDIIAVESPPSPYVLFLFIPSGFWAGGVYSHFTRFQSGKLSRTKRVLVGGMAGFSGTFVFLMMLTILFSLRLSSVDWLQISSISAILGGLGGILSVFGALVTFGAS